MRFAERAWALNPSAICLGSGALTLGHALQISNGFYGPGALAGCR